MLHESFHRSFVLLLRKFVVTRRADTMVTRGTDHSEWVNYLTQCFEPPIYHGNSLLKTTVVRPQQTGWLVESVNEILRPFGRPMRTGLWLPWSNLSRVGNDGQKMCFKVAGESTASYKHTNRTWDRWVHDDVIKWKHFPRYWLFVLGIHRSPVNSPHESQWRGALMFSLICAWINGWINNREAGDLRRYHTHYDVIVMVIQSESRTRLHTTNTSHTI